MAEDWPMYRADAARSGSILQSLADELSLQWTYQSRHAPQPAWQARDTRMAFDYAYDTVIANGMVYFGSSADCKVYALDAETGEGKWEFFTDAPVRFAPTAWKERVFVVSDDGYLYCLAAEDGRLLWKMRGGPDDRMVLGNDRMVSRRPVRGAPVIKDDILYFAAGIWPSEGIFIYAVNPETGHVIWRNDSSGSIAMDQPHPGAFAKSGVSAQGYLVATEEKLLLPTGRAVPASFHRVDVSFEYFHLQVNRASGGSYVVACAPFFFNSGLLFDLQTGTVHLKTVAKHFVVFPDGVVQSASDQVSVFQWVETERMDKRGNPEKFTDLKLVWSVRPTYFGASLILAGRHIVSGGAGGISIIDLHTQNVISSKSVDGIAYGLSAANGNVFVSTNTGAIYCFGDRPNKSVIVQKESEESPYGENEANAQAAEEILRKTEIREGYCLDLDCGNGALAYELAKRTNLQIYAVDADMENVRFARRALGAAGLYGVRVTVHHAEPSHTNYPDSFADLIVSGRAVENGVDPSFAEESARLQRPYGGIVCIGKTGEMKVDVRGALAGTGVWTHQYANAANTICSDDGVIRGPLEILWFRDVDLIMPQRHGRGPAPLFYEGLMLAEGIDALRAVNAYNGRPLWSYPFPKILKEYDQDHLMGAAGTGSNFCIVGDSVFIHDGKQCQRLDVKTGKKINTYELPRLRADEAGTWGYIAGVEDTLFGSSANTSHIVKWRYLQGTMGTQYTESTSLFALDVNTGTLKWKYDANDSIRHNAIAIGNGRVYLMDRPIAEIDKIEYDKSKRRGETVVHPPGVLLALDMQTGDEVWRNEQNIYGTMLALSETHDALLMSYQSTRFQLDSEIGGRMAAFRASTGKCLWDIEAEYVSRPIINGRVIYAQPGAWNLLTGEKKDFQFTRSYGCGILASAMNLLVFRSATLGYRDLEWDQETQNYGGIRPGCWINAIPAGGLVLLPDAASGCTCSYLIQASIALQTMKEG
jgi:outer membrane protein assembly factor BamB